MTIGTFSASYKKTDAYKQNGWYQQPLAANKGLEECNSLCDAFRPALPLLADNLGELKSVAKVSWLWGQDPKRRFCAPTRNGLAQLKIQCAGALSQLIIPMDAIPNNNEAFTTLTTSKNNSSGSTRPN